MTISTLLIGIAASIVFYTNSNVKTFKKPPSKIAKTAIEPLKKSLPEIEEAKQLPISPPEITYTTKPPLRADDTGKKKKVIAKSEVGPETINTNSTNISFDKNTFVILTKEELKRLGIYIKDDVFMYEMNDTRLGDFKTYFGDNVAERSEIWQTPKQNLGGTNPLAMFITTLNGEIKNVLGIFHSPSLLDAKAMAPTLLPIWVEDEKSAAKKTYIAWFEINDKLLSLMPTSVKSNIENNKYFYKHSLPNFTIEEHNFQITDTIHNSSINFVSIDNEQTITPDNVLLNKLGFSSISPINYSRKTNGNRLSINSSNKFTEIDFRFENKDSLNKKIENTYPVFLTSYDSKTQKVFDISYLYEYSDLMKDINIPLLFNNRRFQMIGLMVKGNNPDKIFWYDINDAILNELNPEDKKRIKDYAEINNEHLKGIDLNAKLPEEKSFEEVANGSINNSVAIKTITLNETQLAKLLISVENNVVFQQIPISYKFDKKTGKQLTIKLGFRKRATDLWLDVPVSDFDSAIYVQPRFLSDDLGTWNRVSFDSTYSVSEKISSYNLIPVLVKSGEEYTTMDKLTKKARPDIIFWYEPTEKFLKILDTKTANEIRKDIAALTCNRSKITFTTDSTCDGKSVVSCNYFEACQNTKSKAITKYSVFPNPAKDNFNLKLDLKEECSVVVYMFALNGAEVKQFPIGKIKQGISQKELSSDGITPGLYLLRITTDKGDVFNERILIKE